MKAFAPSNLASRARSTGRGGGRQGRARVNGGRQRVARQAPLVRRRGPSAGCGRPLVLEDQALPSRRRQTLPRASVAKATVTDAHPRRRRRRLRRRRHQLGPGAALEDPSVKSLLRDIFNLPAYTEQLFSFPVHDPHVRHTPPPRILLPGNPGAWLPLRGSRTENGIQSLSCRRAMTRGLARLNQAIDPYKDRIATTATTRWSPSSRTRRWRQAPIQAWVTAKQAAPAGAAGAVPGLGVEREECFHGRWLPGHKLEPNAEWPLPSPFRTHSSQRKGSTVAAPPCRETPADLRASSATPFKAAPPSRAGCTRMTSTRTWGVTSTPHPLHVALSLGASEVARQLLAAGADVHARERLCPRRSSRHVLGRRQRKAGGGFLPPNDGTTTSCRW